MSEDQTRSSELSGRRYVEELTDPWTGETTRYTADTPAELEAAVTADWEPEES